MRGHAFMTSRSGRAIFGAATLVALAGSILLLLQGARPDAPDTASNSFSCGPASLIEASSALDRAAGSRVHAVLVRDPAARRPVTSLHDLARWARDAGFEPVGLRLTGDELSQLPLPAVVHLSPNHFVALIALDETQALVIDQGSITQTLLRETLELRFSGHALCLSNPPPPAASPEG